MKDVVEHDEYTGRFEAVDSVEIRARVSAIWIGSPSWTAPS
jgi:hypothetical protein